MSQITPSLADFTANELNFMRAAYDVVDILAARAGQANFWMTVNTFEGQKIFHDMVACVGNSGIDRGQFIGLHALAQCGDDINGFCRGQGDAELSELLYQSTEDALGQETADQLKSWIQGMGKAQNWDAVEGDFWAKLGAMTHGIVFLDRIKDFDMQDVRERQRAAEYIAGVTNVADSCADISPVLIAFHKTQVETIKRAIADAQSLKPSPPAPF